MANEEQKPATFGAPDHELRVDLQSKAMDLESGALGKFFGNRANAPTNIAGFVTVCLIVAGVLLTAFYGWEKCAEYWKVTSPIVTLALGFVFGKNS